MGHRGSHIVGSWVLHFDAARLWSPKVANVGLTTKEFTMFLSLPSSIIWESLKSHCVKGAFNAGGGGSQCFLVVKRRHLMPDTNCAVFQSDLNLN